MVTKKKDDIMEEAPSESKVCAKKKCCGMSYKLWYFIIIVVLAVAGYYAWTTYQPLMKGPAGENKMTDQQVAAIVAKVRQHMVLPDKEVPQMAEIKDAALAAKEQPFLAGSQNGDVLMVYTSISKAILYSPARDRIINVGPVQMGNTDQTSASTSPTPETPKKK